MRKYFAAGLVLAGCLWSALAWAQLSHEEGREAQQVRQSVFELLSYNAAALNGMARGTVEFDPEQAELHAERIAVLAPMILDAFETDTRSSGAYTRAKDFVWDNWDTFEQYTHDLVRSANIMKAAAADGDLAAVRENVRLIGRACGACHDLFRFQESDPGWLFRDHPRANGG